MLEIRYLEAPRVTITTSTIADIEVGDYVEVYDNSGLMQLTPDGMKSACLSACQPNQYTRTRLKVIAIGCSLPSDALSKKNNSYIVTDGKLFYFARFLKKWY